MTPQPLPRKAKALLDDIVSRGRGGPPGPFPDAANGQNGTVQELMIPAGKAGLVIGKGGETIKQLQVPPKIPWGVGMGEIWGVLESLSGVWGSLMRFGRGEEHSTAPGTPKPPQGDPWVVLEGVSAEGSRCPPGTGGGEDDPDPRRFSKHQRGQTPADHRGALQGAGEKRPKPTLK